jgi:hypothetical protein
VAGDEAFEWAIPEHLDGAELVAIEAYVNDPSSSGSVQVQIHNETQGLDMLSTKVSIDVGELDSANATVPVVINTANSVVAHKDHLRVDVDSAGVGATGLGLILTFLPSVSLRLLVQGAQGPAGGVTTWTGGWQGGTTYNEGDAVSNNGSSYVSIVNHISGATSEPGVGANWEDFWQLLSEHQTNSAVTLVINGNGLVIDVGVKGHIEVPFTCEIWEVVLLADQIGSVVVDVWKETYANYPPINGDSITGSSPPTISSAQKSVDSVLAGWTTTINAGDILAFHVDSCSLITRLTVALKVRR